MKKMFAVVVTGAVVLGSMAMAMTSSTERVDEARVQEQIDARLLQLLVKARTAHAP